MKTLTNIHSLPFWFRSINTGSQVQFKSQNSDIYLVSKVFWRGKIFDKLKWKRLLFSLLITGCRLLSIGGNWDSAPPLQITAGSELTELIWAHELHQLSSRSRDLYFLPHTDANLMSLHAPRCLAVVTWANYVHFTLFLSSSPLCWFHLGSSSSSRRTHVLLSRMQQQDHFMYCSQQFLLARSRISVTGSILG